MKFDVKETKIEGLKIVYFKKITDDRGYFTEIYNKTMYKKLNVENEFKQLNYSKSNKNTLRGLHFQLEKMQGKLVYVSSGSVFDVVVDLRKNSSTFLNSFTIELSESNNVALYVPPGFAHGFLSLEDNTILNYLTTEEYNQETQFGIMWNDPELNITWRTTENLIISEKDKCLMSIKEFEKKGFII